MVEIYKDDEIFTRPGQISFPVNEARKDFFNLLTVLSPQEIERIEDALENGFINGAIGELMPVMDAEDEYVIGECGCLFAVSKEVRNSQQYYNEFYTLRETLNNMAGREGGADQTVPIERFIFDVEPGDLPENNQELATIKAWLDEWKANRGDN